MDPNAGANAAPTQRAQQLHMQRFCPENVAHNAKQLYYIRSVTTSVAGSTAGVLGLVNLSGFYLYLATIVTTNVVIFLVNVRVRPQSFLLSFNSVNTITSVEVARSGTNSSKHRGSVSPVHRPSSHRLAHAWPYVGFVCEGMQEMAFGYVLWWTLWTALVHVFD